MIDFPRRWGSYVLIRPLGSGGMGLVFLALGGRLGRDKLCVVKRLNTALLKNPESLARFRREADIVRTLSHGVIAQTHAVDSFDGEPFIVQEYVQGRTLTQLVAAGRSADQLIPPTIAIYIAREVARALVYAHSIAQIVHRDIAPDNVMASFGGEVRLIDFGIARAGGDASLTAPGTWVGRACYAAPEVLAGKTADTRSDIYSLGVLLWELLVGRMPGFDELAASPRPSALNPSLEPELDEVVLKAIATDPASRFSNAEDLQRSLGPFLPPTFIGEGELARFISRCYDVERERQTLRDEVREARELLNDESDRDAGPQEGIRTATLVTALPRLTSRWPWVLAAAGFAAAAAALIHDRIPSSLAPQVVARPEPAANGHPAVRPSEPSEPRPQPQPATAFVAPPLRVAPPITVTTPRAAAARPALPRRPPPRLPTAALLDRARDDLQSGDFPSAAQNAESVLQNGTNAEKSLAHYILGKVHVLNGERKPGALEFATAVTLNPQNLEAADELARLRRTGAP